MRLALLAAGAVIASPASAFVCHPDPVGARTLAVRGYVADYVANAGAVTVALRVGRCTRIVVWRPPRRSSTETSRRSCGAARTHPLPGVARAVEGDTRATVEPDGTVAVTVEGVLVRRVVVRHGARSELLALADRRLLVLVPPTGDDSPAELHVYSLRTGSLVRRWPLPFVAATLAAAHDTALMNSAGGNGLYALRLSDGRIAFVAANRSEDRPQFAGRGIVYQSASRRGSRSVLKYIPLGAVRRELSVAGRAQTLPGPIGAFAMDGPRVATAVRDASSGCDRITFWNIPWSYVASVTEPEDGNATCPTTGSRPRVTALAIGGIRATWILSRDRQRELVTSTSKACIEVVLATNGAGRAVAADGHVASYATSRGVETAVGDWSAVVAAGETSSVRAVAVDAGDTAVLRRDGTIELWPADGLGGTVVHEPAARAIALRAGHLVVLTKQSLVVVDRTTRERTAWPVPPRTAPAIDVHYGIAVVTAGRRIYAIDIANGRTRVVAITPAPARAAIEAPGIAYGYNVAGRGRLGFVPLARLEQAFR